MYTEPDMGLNELHNPVRVSVVHAANGQGANAIEAWAFLAGLAAESALYYQLGD